VKNFPSTPEGGGLYALYILPFALNQRSFLTALLLGGVLLLCPFAYSVAKLDHAIIFFTQN
jgi:hypothetical protein